LSGFVAFEVPIWPGFTFSSVWPRQRRSTRISSVMRAWLVKDLAVVGASKDSTYDWVRALRPAWGSDLLAIGVRRPLCVNDAMRD
jgi:hypothetical protein